MRLRSGESDTCLADMYPPISICGPSMVGLDCMVMEKLDNCQHHHHCQKSNTYDLPSRTFIAG
jgi:hypothetical protein